MAGMRFGGVELEAMAAYERELRRCVEMMAHVGEKLHDTVEDMPNTFVFSEYKYRLVDVMEALYHVRGDMEYLAGAVAKERKRYYDLIDEVSTRLDKSSLYEKTDCPNCEKSVPSDAKFCPYCGVELEKAGGDQ